MKDNHPSFFLSRIHLFKKNYKSVQFFLQKIFCFKKNIIDFSKEK